MTADQSTTESLQGMGVIDKLEQERQRAEENQASASESGHALAVAHFEGKQAGLVRAIELLHQLELDSGGS